MLVFSSIEKSSTRALLIARDFALFYFSPNERTSGSLEHISNHPIKLTGMKTVYKVFLFNCHI